ncbi:MAG TPA: glycosyltransferase family 4 protein [Granulicella sp.]|nr:glycosyltransferase family 4 protein [Granulicella sp.]
MRRNSTSAAPLVVVVAGQVPPPVNGQSLMIQEFLRGSYEGLRLEHVPLRFSRSTAEIGAFDLRKIWVLARTVADVVRARFRSGATVLYYPPAGPNLVPVLRDLVLLSATRWLFKKTAFHFHAAGLASIYPRLPWPLKPLFWFAYSKPDLAIFTTAATATEATVLQAGARCVVPCGIHDEAAQCDVAQCDVEKVQSNGAFPTILFAGILCEGKGLITLLEACDLLHRAGMKFRLVCIGAFESAEFRKRTEEFIRSADLQSSVEFPGVVVGSDKIQLFRTADVFCFPSHYASESFGVVLIEAMCFSLPIVATRWRGIPEVTGEEGTFLVEVRDACALATRLNELMRSPELRLAMGQRNRQRYLDRFTMQTYRTGMSNALEKLA